VATRSAPAIRAPCDPGGGGAHGCGDLGAEPAITQDEVGVPARAQRLLVAVELHFEVDEVGELQRGRSLSAHRIEATVAPRLRVGRSRPGTGRGVYRVLLTGLHLLRTGEVQAGLSALNQELVRVRLA
jgi:hypothetical protein